MGKKAASTAPKPFCFVLMPFDQSFDDIYRLGIKDACDKAGAYCERVDEQIFHDRILDRIYNQISKADVVIADMSGRNANVFYEVGYAHALGKRTILITKDAGDIPFDLKHFPHIIYSSGISQLKDELSRRVEWCICNPLAKQQNPESVELYLDGVGLSTGKAVLTYPLGVSKKVVLSLCNHTSTVLGPGDVVVYCYQHSSYLLDELDGFPAAGVVDKDGVFALRFRFAESVFPEQSVNIGFYVYIKPESVEQDQVQTVHLKLFTALGRREFSFSLAATR